MNEEYEKILKRTPELAIALNSIIVKRVEELKSSWKAFLKERIATVFKQVGIQLPTDPKLSLKEILSNTFKKDYYYVCRGYMPRTAAKGKEPLLIFTLVVQQGSQQFNNTNFYVEDNPEVDFRIDFKRMKKDTIFLC